MEAPPETRYPQAILLAPADGGLALARSLRRRGVAIAMLVEGRMQWVAGTRSARSYRLGQLPRDRDGWLACLSELANEGDGVLIPGTDRLCEFLVRERSRIPERLRSFEGTASPHLKLMDKRSLYELASEAGVRCPWSLSLRTLTELDRVAADASYPCLLKPALSHHWRRLIGSNRAIVLEDPEQLVQVAEEPLELGLELLVTELIPGPDRNLAGAVTVRNADGSYPLSYGLRKLRSYPPGYGTGSLHESADVPETITLARRLLDSVGFVGVANVETKRHSGTGELVLIEVNVRLPRCWGLADASGTDGSWRLYSSLAGMSLAPQPSPRIGIGTIAPSLEPRAAVTNLAQGRLTVRQLLGGYRGVRDLSGLSLRDPGPIMVLIVRHLAALARWVARVLRRP